MFCRNTYYTDSPEPPSSEYLVYYKTIQEYIFIFKRLLNNAPMLERVNNKLKSHMPYIYSELCYSQFTWKAGTKFKHRFSRGKKTKLTSDQSTYLESFFSCFTSWPRKTCRTLGVMLVKSTINYLNWSLKKFTWSLA